MPAYDYKCQKCKEVHEYTVPYAEKQTSPLCPKCKSPMKEVYSFTGMKFIGDGFYVNDYKRN